MDLIKGKVSICTTTYNRPNLIKKLIESILSQSYINFEIIITDNSENEETKKVIEEYNLSQIRYIKNQRNIGMGKNALKAFSYIDGEFMTFTPDDDIWNDRDKLLRQVDFFLRHPEINIQYSNAYSIDYEGNILEEFSSVYKTKQEEILKGDELLPGGNTEYFLNILTTMLRTDKLLNIFRESYHFNSEEYLCYYVATCEEKIGFIYDKLVSLREAEHYREVELKGKIYDWKNVKSIRVNQILSIYTTLVNLHPCSRDKLESEVVQNFLTRYLFSIAIRSKSIKLALFTILKCYMTFENIRLLKLLKLKNKRRKSFG